GPLRFTAYRAPSARRRAGRQDHHQDGASPRSVHSGPVPLRNGGPSSDSGVSLPGGEVSGNHNATWGTPNTRSARKIKGVVMPGLTPRAQAFNQTRQLYLATDL